MASRLDSLHAQLGCLLENAQSLLADSAPSSTYGGGGGGGYYGQQGYRRYGAAGPAPLPVYSFLAMQVRSDNVSPAIWARKVWSFWAIGLGPDPSPRLFGSTRRP